MSINVFTFAGRLGRDAELRYTAGNKAVLGFAVAVDVGYGENKSILWVDCSLWGERGEKLADYLTKGSIVTVTGEASLQTYQSQVEQKTKLACRVNEVQLPPLSKDRPAPQRQESPHSKPPANQGFDDDDIPF